MSGQPLTRARRERLELATEQPDFWEEMAQRMLDSEQPETVNDICKSKDIPYSMFVGWMAQDDERQERFKKLLALQAAVLVNQVVGIADGQDDPTNKKVRIDTRFRVAKYHAPDTYGDKTETNVNLGVQVEIVRFAREPLTIEAASGGALHANPPPA